MNGLVYSLDDDSDNTPIFWMGVFVAAMVVHALPFFCFSFNTTPPPPAEEAVSISLDDSFLNMLAEKTESTPAQPELQPSAAVAAAALPKAIPAPPIPADAPASVVEPPPAVPEKPKAAPKPAAPMPPPPPTAQPVKAPPEAAANRPLNEKDLPSLKPNIDTAFDEDKHTSKAAPKDAYNSDRNSTAADRGPKNLPQGDPYIDKGDTNLIKYLGKRGEGNVPAVASDVKSGSVKKEGAEESGDGNAVHAKDFSKNVRTAELTNPAPKDTTLKAEAPQEVAVAPAKKLLSPQVPPEEAPLPPPPPAIAVRPEVRPTLKPKSFEPEPAPSETGTLPPPKRPKEIVADTVALPTNFDIDPPKTARKLAPKDHIENAIAQNTQADPSVLQPTSIDKAIDAQAELDRFEAQLNGVNKAGAADGTPGTGAKLRKGQKGHEGNGVARPGDDNAVSDVTSINLESSASELGDPRFAKKFDAKTAYIKSFARRIDGKWKADIQAHLRINLAPGTVSIRIVIRKDGVLMEVSEAYRDRGVPDENVASARRAVKEAANPTADPFPPALAERDTIEYTFNFLYQ